MKKIGDLFKQRRQEMQISLKDAENSTSIRMVYLQAIEDGELQKLISPIYAQGFVKQYAVLLGLDGDSIIRDNPEIFNRTQPQEFAYGIGTLEFRGNPGGSVKWFPNAMWIGVVVLILVVAWYFAKFLEVI